MGVTKTDFMRGMQCEKMLWLDRHKPNEKIIPAEVQKRLDEGNEFGDRAMGCFGEYTEVTAYKPDGSLDFTKMIKNTKECIEKSEAIVVATGWKEFIANKELITEKKVYDLRYIF